MNKIVKTLAEAIRLSGLKDGMTISFHHHLRNGDHVLNMVMAAVAEMGIKNLTVNASSLFDVHTPLLDHIQNGVVTGLETSYMSAAIGRAISHGVLKRPVVFRSHGLRASDIDCGRSAVDVAFLAAPTADAMGNATGRIGKSACGSLGYAVADARHAKRVVVITDSLASYPVANAAIEETDVDYVVCVDKIGEASGIVSGTTQITRDPVGLAMARDTVRLIQHSGLFRDGFAFQTGAGGASLAVAQYLKDAMIQENIRGSFALGGVTGFLVDMLESGCFKNIMDVQCFDLKAVASIRDNPSHIEISASHYAGPSAKSCATSSLDVVILGATEIDTRFNVNVHTDSNGFIIGGSGGHNDAAAGAKISVILAPLIRARLPLICDKVTCVTTPGGTVDVLVTQKGIAVNPARPELRQRLSEAGLNIKDIEELKRTAEKITGVPDRVKLGKTPVGSVIYRDGRQIDTIFSVD